MSAAAPTRPRRRAASRDPDLRLVEARGGRRNLLYALAIALLCAVAVFATVTTHALAAADAMRTHELEQRLVDAERTYGALTAEVSRLEDPARIETVATRRLGMQPATTSRFVVLERPLPDDRRGDGEMVAGAEPDPLKQVLTVER